MWSVRPTVSTSRYALPNSPAHAFTAAQGTKTPIFYVALAEKILTDQETLHIHALGSCIEAAVGVADRLERNGLATVAKIRTDRSGRREGTAQIVISVARAKNFNELFEKQKEERNSRSAAYEV